MSSQLTHPSKLSVVVLFDAMALVGVLLEGAPFRFSFSVDMVESTRHTEKPTLNGKVPCRFALQHWLPWSFAAWAVADMGQRGWPCHLITQAKHSPSRTRYSFISVPHTPTLSLLSCVFTLDPTIALVASIFLKRRERQRPQTHQIWLISLNPFCCRQEQTNDVAIGLQAVLLFTSNMWNGFMTDLPLVLFRSVTLLWPIR